MTWSLGMRHLAGLPSISRKLHLVNQATLLIDPLFSSLQVTTGLIPTLAAQLMPSRSSVTWRPERPVSTQASPRYHRRTGGPARARPANTSGLEIPWMEDST